MALLFGAIALAVILVAANFNWGGLIGPAFMVFFLYRFLRNRKKRMIATFAKKGRQVPRRSGWSPSGTTASRSSSTRPRPRSTSASPRSSTSSTGASSSARTSKPRSKRRSRRPRPRPCSRRWASSTPAKKGTREPGKSPRSPSPHSHRVLNRVSSMPDAALRIW